jgi:hypothetical protein
MLRRGWLLVLLAGLWAPPALAQNALSIKAFYGTFSGSGVASNADSLYFAVTERDFDVVIKAEGSGFSAAWTTVQHTGGDPAHPRTKRRQDKIVFVPTGAPNQWRAAEQPDPMSGKPYAWARIEGTSLIIYVLTIDADGRYDVQRYDRTFVGPSLQLTFTDTRDGEPVRTVKGRLVKISD